MMNTLWRARTSHVCWQSWDEFEFLVFDAGSGDTHLLDRVAAEALRQLQHDTLTGEQLAGQVGDALGLAGETASPKFAEQISQVVARFDRLGLIEPV